MVKKIHPRMLLGSSLNPDWHELWKQEKCLFLEPPRGIFYKTQWAWQDVKLTQLMSIFTSKKVQNFFDKKSAGQNMIQNSQGDKSFPLMPIRVNIGLD